MACRLRECDRNRGELVVTALEDQEFDDADRRDG
jgi:hypothetical protein